MGLITSFKPNDYKTKVILKKWSSAELERRSNQGIRVTYDKQVD